MMVMQPGGRQAGGDAWGRERASDGRKGSSVSITTSRRTPRSSLSCLCPSAEAHSLQRICRRSRVKTGMFFTPVVCGRINQKIAAHQALRLELNPFKSVPLSSHPLII